MVAGLSALSACGDDGASPGTGGSGGAGPTGGAGGGGRVSTAGMGVGGSAAGLTFGGNNVGGNTVGGSSGALDMARVRKAHEVARRFSLGDANDRNVCIARAEGGAFCDIVTIGTVLPEQEVDLVTTSGLGYCAILDDKSVTCANATSDSAASKEFAASVTTAATLFKSGDGLMVVDAAGAVRAWNGEQESTAQVAAGSSLGGRDFEVCALAPDGGVKCFDYIPGNTFDKASFGLSSTKYAGISQSLSTFAAIDLQGKLRVRNKFEDADKEYPTETFVEVAAYSDYWCMLTNAGTLKCDAYDINQGPAGIANVPSGEFLAVDVNEVFACAVRTTGELVCWGGSAPTIGDKVRIE